MTETRRRYPGTGPFGPEDAALFFGREREKEELYLRILSVPLLLQFGKSGLGKTSLLQAGLFPLLRAKPFLPVMIRLNDPNESLTDAVARSIRESVIDEGVEVDDDAPAGLWELLSNTTAWRKDLLLTPVLVFDQFEEVFTLRDQAFRDNLASELGALATGIPPERLSDQRTDRPDVKLVISLKETHLGALEQFSADIPGLFQERLRLEPLSEANARDAVLEPARLHAHAGERPYWTKPFAYDANALDAMLTYLKGRSDVIEPFQLQLLARHAEGIVFRKPPSMSGRVTLTTDDFKGSNAFGEVLKNFYRDVLSHISNPIERKRAARLCEDGLLGSAGQRLMLEKKQILGDYELSENTLDVLARERLIREVRRMESTFYELSHDRLADSVFAARSLRMPKAVKRMLWAGAVVGLLAIVAIIGVALVTWNRTIEKERDNAENLLEFLLGEHFLGEVRDIGNSTLLVQVQQQVDSHAGDMRSAVTRGLALRNRGEIQRTNGDLAAAVQSYRQALQSFVDAPDTADAFREMARTHDRLGNALGNQGKLSKSMPVVEEADVLWRKVANTPGDPHVVRADCMSMAESGLFTVQTRTRMGQAKPALVALDNVVAITSEILFGRDNSPPRCAVMTQTAATYPDPTALRLLSNAAMFRAFLLHSEQDQENATILAFEARRLQPASLSTRTHAIETLAWRGRMRGLRSPAEALADYRTALAEYEELRRSDPDNDDWKRKRATSELLVSEGIVACHEKPGACNPLPDLDDAEEMLLEAKAALRSLASHDATNDSLRDDLVGAEHVYFSILQARKASAPERLEAIRNAQRLHEQTGRDPADADRDQRTVEFLGEESDILLELGQIPAAQETLRRAIDLITKLLNEHPANLTYYDTMAATRAREAKLLLAIGDTQGAAVASQREVDANNAHARLDQQEIEVAAEPERRADATLANAVNLANAGNHNAAAREFVNAASLLREALRRRPAAYVIYEKLADAFLRMQGSYKALGARNQRLAALNASMHAAQIAAWVAPADKQGEGNHLLLQVRDTFAQMLIEENTPDSYQTARSLLLESIVVAESLTQRDPNNAEYFWSLGNAKGSLGIVRRNLDAPGWEGAIRSGLINLKKAVTLQPTNLSYRQDYASRRKQLGDLLASDGKMQQAEIEYTIALNEYEILSQTAPHNAFAREINQLRAFLATH